MNYDIVFQEIPGEITLAINISNCPNRCKGCHSPYLWDNTGEILNQDSLVELLEKYGNSITCLCFMGGDSEPGEIEKLAAFVHQETNGKIKTGWYTGKKDLPAEISFLNFNYIKTGPYIPELGGLRSKKTNQRFYRIQRNEMIDCTKMFYQNNTIRV